MPQGWSPIRAVCSRTVSIVAREYGIPAVLGVGNGTERIAHGQLITIDGDAGTVVIREEV